jgi:hypothetical protein
LNSSNPSSIIVGNDSSLLIISVGDSVLPGPFYLINILLAHDIVQSLLSVRRFTTDNWCSIKFDLFGLSVKDLATRNVIVRSNSTNPLYMMHLLRSVTPSSDTVTALAVVALATWHCRLGHPGTNALSSLSRSSFINCTSNKHDLCHVCQLGKHNMLPFSSSSNRAAKAIDLIHFDLWISPVVSVLGSKYYLVILDDFTHYLWTFSLNLNLTPSLHCPTSLLMLLLSSAAPSRPSSVTTGVSLTTLPLGPFFCQKGHSSGCRVLTRPLRMVKPNASFAPLTMSYACCLFRLPFSGAIGLTGFTLHIY